MDTIEQRGLEILRSGFMPPDKNNLIIFKRVMRDYILVAFFAFGLGIFCAIPLAKLATDTRTEQISRTSAIYSHNRGDEQDDVQRFK